MFDIDPEQVIEELEKLFENLEDVKKHVNEIIHIQGNDIIARRTKEHAEEIKKFLDRL
jgi:phosphate uptake regulator